MYRSKRVLSLPLTTLSVLFASVILFGGSVSAQTLTEARPLSANEQLIQEQSQQIEQKSTILQSTSQELQTLEEKKKALADQLANEKKIIEELKAKIAEKKRIEAIRAGEQARRNSYVAPATESVRAYKPPQKSYAGNSAGNTYDAGYCTWYTKNMRPDLPNNLGNANTWYSRAAAQGLSVGSVPKAGAIGTTTRGEFGHTVYVQSVSADGQMVTISEMNYRGLYVISTRTVSASEFLYIY